ncbi:hypothetical protein MKX01_021105 [Papaver californicum]|nr:hypothetical protein MKX01_021105 [Papaver californicum]
MQCSCLYNGGWTVSRRVQVKLDTETVSSSNLITKCSSFPRTLLTKTPLFLCTYLINLIPTIPITTRNPLSSILSPHSSNSAITTTSDDGENHFGKFRRWIELVGEVLSTALPLWVALACLLGLLKPNSFNWIQPKLSLLGITVIMLGMGMTLTIGDLCGALAMPKELLCGFFLQYSVMPLSGFFVSKPLGLPSYCAAGLILVACCPGGILISFWVLFSFSISRYCFTNSLSSFISNLCFLCDTGTASNIVTYIARQNASAVLTSGRQLVLASCLLHGLGYTLGYLLSRMLKLDESSSRTISIEVGMQNSALGLVLAVQHFGSPVTAVPCVVSSVFQSLFGSLLAGIWRYSTATTPTTNDRNRDNDNLLPGINS